MKYRKDYEILLDLFPRLVESQAGKHIDEGEEWLNDAQTLSTKLYQHLVSVRGIAEGVTIRQDEISLTYFIDHASIKVLARAALETYLVFFHIYGCKNMGLSEFRHNVWVIGGLSDRQTMHASIDENRIKLINEKNQIEKLAADICESEWFQDYTSKQKKQLLKGNWRISLSWSDIGVNAGFHKTYFDNIYNYLCGYSHSSYISALQVGQAKNIDIQNKLAESVLGICCVVMAHFVFSYSDCFSSANEVLNSYSAAKETASKWYLKSDDMTRIYNR